MFGTFRLILAIAVAAMHAGVQVLGLEQGVIAVICFYILSGFVMAALLERHYAHLGRPSLIFYADRALRIGPQYAGFVLLTLACVLFLPIENDWIRPGDLTPGTLVANVAVVPLNYFMLFDIPRLVPPSWSLGAEVQFYLLAPVLVLVRPVRWIGLGLGLSAIVLALLGLIDSDIFGYRVLPGILSFFLTGVLIHAALRGDRVARRVLGGLAVGFALLGLALQLSHREPWLGHEIIGGYLLGLIGVSVLARLRPSRWDDRLGSAAYGTFLAHWLVIWLIGRFHVLADAPNLVPAVVVIAAVGLGSAAFFVFERPVIALRRGLRNHTEHAPADSMRHLRTVGGTRVAEVVSR
jgi:peptidoglycan/LPS O-acetylase OafA/YrhL